METLEDARQLSELMVDIAKLSDRKAIAVLSDMNQPLGKAVGNALELREAIDTLHGNGPEDFYEHCLHIAGYMLLLGGMVASKEAGMALAREKIENGMGWNKFRELVIAQGGDVTCIDMPEKLPTASIIDQIKSVQSGYIDKINARIVGESGVLLGAGRSKKGEPIDHAVGIIVHKKVGDYVEQNEPIFTIHADDHQRLKEAKEQLLKSIHIKQEMIQALPLFYGVID